ncbi:MAG: cyclase family protein [Gammaproteobacteria bacterium]|nr:cyclase family protein [Gammaproteobacteria bacterium]MDD9896091.1 cyclase family protein [Gammaproteobacteria bacterium]MDD9957487.1 cyclase family protein [Gammaproteobacteria bacterium]
MIKKTINVLIAVLLVSTTFLFQTNAQEQLSQQEVNGWFETLSNWGRWGTDDQLGTVNHITEETRVAAAQLVETGVSVSMAHPILTDEAADNFNPYDHRMTSIGSSPGPWSGDFIGVSYHGYAHSHLDALCHRFQFGTMYNGYPEDEVTEEGCNQLSIAGFGNGIFGRGIVMDFPRLRGVDWLENGTAITPEWLDEWEEEHGITVGPGDIVLIRTGRWPRRAAVGPWNLAQDSAGLHASSVAWLKERDVAMVGSDSALDVKPSGVTDFDSPVHALVLVALGMPIFDNLDLEAVAEEAIRHDRPAFLFTTAPLRVEGGTGSPLNPIATF